MSLDIGVDRGYLPIFQGNNTIKRITPPPKKCSIIE